MQTSPHDLAPTSCKLYLNLLQVLQGNGTPPTHGLRSPTLSGRECRWRPPQPPMTMNAPSASTISPTPYRLKTPARVPVPASGHATTASADSVTPKSRPRPTPSVHCAGLYDRSSSGPSSNSTATQPSRLHYLYPGCDPLRPPHDAPRWRASERGLPPACLAVGRPGRLVQRRGMRVVPLGVFPARVLL